jgi:hypothetical protein
MKFNQAMCEDLTARIHDYYWSLNRANMPDDLIRKIVRDMHYLVLEDLLSDDVSDHQQIKQRVGEFD